MGFRGCDPLGIQDEFIGLGLLWKEHLYQGPRTGQEDGLLTQPSKYFSYLLVTKKIELLPRYLIKKRDDCEKARHRTFAVAIPLGTRNPESRSETS